MYSTRKIDEDEYIIRKMNNLYSKDNKNLKKELLENPEKFLMYHYDPKSFNKILTVIEQYSEEVNPLAQYYEENKEYIRKYAKKDNDPYIKSLKYKGNKLGVHHDVTDKYLNSSHRLVKLTIQSLRFDVYLTSKGYKIISILYKDITKKNNYYYISNEHYQSLKKEKGISEDDQFIGSFYKNDLIELDGELFKVIGVNDIKRNIISLDMVDIRYGDYCELMGKNKSNLRKSISKNTKMVQKYHADILGNMYKSSKAEKPQLIFKKGAE